MSDETVRILVFSDDKDKRAAVINGIGLRASKDTPRIEWVEAATGFGVRDAFDSRISRCSSSTPSQRRRAACPSPRISRRPATAFPRSFS